MAKQGQKVENKKQKINKFKVVVGVDEAGRGPLCGPVVAAAVVFRDETKWDNLPRSQRIVPKFEMSEIKDSKKMTAKRRKKVYQLLKEHPQVEWDIGRAGERVIDKINILQATKLAMVRAVRNLEKKLANEITQSKTGTISCDRRKLSQKGSVDLLLIDGNFGIDLPYSQKSIVKGDEKVFLIKLASIVAKVTRDKAMLRYHKKYPEYGFDRHKGYPTKLHKEMLKKYGPCKIHRRSFGPVREIKNKK